jgi:bifunctional non-homologous end joining protein LigD
MKTENITLFYKQGKSDKVYKVSLEENNNKYLVNFAYGRRGATLKTGTKTQTAVEYEKAKKIYDKLVLSKSAKGYIPDEDTTPTAYMVDSEQRKTGVHCQLLNQIEEGELTTLFESDAWWMQEKKDGKRMLLQKSESETIAINRKGLSVGAPQMMIESANAVKEMFTIDGEAIDEILYLFDILAYDGEDLKDKPYEERYALLTSLKFGSNIVLVQPTTTKKEKMELFEKLKSEGSEGVVFKQKESPYQAGRPNSGGTQVKFKFYKTASVIVSVINDKRSVGMSLIEEGKEVFVGNVTISPNKEVPKKDEVIEVRYLYAYKGGSLYQPTFLEVRTDIDRAECLMEQLSFKGA